MNSREDICLQSHGYTTIIFPRIIEESFVYRTFSSVKDTYIEGTLTLHQDFSANMNTKHIVLDRG